MSAKVQGNDLEIEEDNRRSATFALRNIFVSFNYLRGRGGGCKLGYATKLQLVVF
jgi:hypothetical protein